MNKKEQLNTFLNHAREELRRYHSTKKLIHLQQMGEKMYNAYIYLLECIKNTEISSHHQVTSMTKSMNDKDLIELGQAVNYLHTFFYEGRGDDYWIIKSYQKCVRLITNVRKKYGV